MLARLTSWMKRTKTKTPTTTPPSGLSWEELHTPIAVPYANVYRELTDEIHSLLSRKRGYYGCPGESPLENALSVQEDGVHPVTYQLCRIGEKCRRMRGLTRTMAIGAMRETLQDIAGHALVAIACLDAGEDE